MNEQTKIMKVIRKKERRLAGGAPSSTPVLSLHPEKKLPKGDVLYPSDWTVFCGANQRCNRKIDPRMTNVTATIPAVATWETLTALVKSGASVIDVKLTAAIPV